MAGERVKRNHRFLRKLNLTPKLESAIRNKNVAILSDNLLTPINVDLSLKDIDLLSKITFKDDDEEEEETQRYNLRSRK